ncbi:Primosomal protein I [Vibrio cholerae]|nr:Primosomal protein I [Vibrio cholerae]
MRFSLYINQEKAMQWGLNIQQAILFSYIHDLPTWGKSFVVSGEVYYWSGKDKIISELPILTDKPDTIKRHMAALEKLGLIERTVCQNRALVRVTDKGKQWNKSEEGREINPNQVGKNIPTGREKNPDQGGKKIPTKSGKKSRILDNQDPITSISNKKNKQKSDLDFPEFETFWKAYPTKANKQGALKSFKAALKNQNLTASEFTEMLVSDVSERIKRKQFGFDKLHATTYLNNERWNDPHEENQPRVTESGYRPNSIDAYNERLLAKYGHASAPIEREINPVDGSGLG